MSELVGDPSCSSSPPLSITSRSPPPPPTAAVGGPVFVCRARLACFQGETKQNRRLAQAPVREQNSNPVAPGRSDQYVRHDDCQ